MLVQGSPPHVGYSISDSSIARIVGGRCYLRSKFKFDVCSFRVGECLPTIVEWRNSPHVTRSLRAKSYIFKLMPFPPPSLPDFRIFLEVATDDNSDMMEIVGPTDVRSINLTCTPQTRLDLIEHMGNRGRRIADHGANQPPQNSVHFLDLVLVPPC